LALDKVPFEKRILLATVLFQIDMQNPSSSSSSTSPSSTSPSSFFVINAKHFLSYLYLGSCIKE
jgi:hypothetical protein